MLFLVTACWGDVSSMDQIEPNSRFSFTISENSVRIRLDVYIAQQFSQYSRSFFRRLIGQGWIKINNIVANKQGTWLKIDDIVTIQFPPKRIIKPTSIDQLDTGIHTIYKHEHFLIIFKPVNLLVHPPSVNSTEATLVDWLVVKYKEIQAVGYASRPGIVHRLDKDTSGIIVIPRTNYAYTIFAQLFKNRSINKTYYALVEGHPEKKGSIDLPIGRDPITRTKMKAFSQNNLSCTTKKIRSAITHYKVIKYFDKHSLIKVTPITGRTHQIRVHCTAIGHPIVGDVVYGKKSSLIKRQALHAQKLSFTFNNKSYTFSSNFPDDFKNAVKMMLAKK